MGRIKDIDSKEDKKIAGSTVLAMSVCEKGIAARSYGNMEEAISIFNSAVGIAPHFYPAWHLLGSTLQETGQYKKSLDALKKALETKTDYKNFPPYNDPDDTPIHYIFNSIGNTYSSIGHRLISKNRLDDAINYYNQAIEHYMKAVNNDENYSNAYNGMGNAYGSIAASLKMMESNIEAEKNLRLALEHLNKAIQLSPNEHFVPTTKEKIEALNGLLGQNHKTREKEYETHWRGIGPYQFEAIVGLHLKGSGKPYLTTEHGLKCLKCGKIKEIEDCSNCGSDEYRLGLDSNENLGLFCGRCKKGISFWKCECGCVSPISNETLGEVVKYDSNSASDSSNSLIVGIVAVVIIVLIIWSC